MGVKTTDFYNKIAGLADTPGTQINVAEVRRVLRLAFLELGGMPPIECLETVAKAMAAAWHGTVMTKRQSL